MDFNFFFRRFFPNNPGSMSDPFFEIDDDQRNERGNAAVYDDDFHNFDQHMNMFQQMEDMFNKMFSSSFGMLGFLNLDENLTDEQSPRSIMIKDSKEKPCDSSSCKKEFGRIDLSPYHENGKQLIEKPHSFSYSKFASIKTVHLPDGTVEEHRTIIDNGGNKTTTVRRSIGDTSHEVVTKSDKQGIKEKEENFMNLDENELTNFEQKWNKLRYGDPMEPSAPSLGLPSSSPSYWYLLKKFFGPSKKDEVKWC